MVRIAHISDTHIRNLKHHKQYNTAFADLYKKLKKQKPDYIIHCGDIAHSKTDISPELIDMISDFLRNLAKIAPTHVILGNHDGNLKNGNRQDAVSPIASAIAEENLHLYKESQEVDIGSDIVLNVLSVFDRQEWLTEPTNDSKINIALYHGSVAGCKTETGFILEHGIDISVLRNFDYALLGDIHKTNQKLDREGRVRYCGSTIQQNHGETNDKGFLIWDIEDKDNFEVTHHEIYNPNPYITVTLTPTGKLPKNLEVPENARIRIRSRKQISIDAMRRAQTMIQTKFNPESIVTQNNVDGIAGSLSEEMQGVREEDLRDPRVQEQLIKEFLSNNELDEDLLKDVISINQQVNSRLNMDDASRNFHWKIKNLQWDNLFNYGEGNKIDFENLSGVIGIFGENYSGKSSVVDSLCYALFNKTSKGAINQYNIINQNKRSCTASVTVDVGGNDYVVERSTEKYVKNKARGEEDARSFADFIKKSGDECESLNGDDRRATDRNIIGRFGSIDDFMLTSMSSQTDSLTFIREGSARRKDILAKFLDLLVFKEKYDIAKERETELRVLVDSLKNKDFDNDIASATSDMVRIENQTKEKKEQCSTLRAEWEEVLKDIALIQSKIDSVPAEIIDAEKLNAELARFKQEKVVLEETKQELEDSIEEGSNFLEKCSDFLESFNLEELEKKKSSIRELENEINTLIGEERSAKEKVNVASRKAKLLKEVPCGDKFLSCKLLKDATVADGKLPSLNDTLHQIESRRQTQEHALALLDSNSVISDIEKYNKLLDKKREKERLIEQNTHIVDKTALEIASKERAIEDTLVEISEYEKNKEAIENLESLVRDQSRLQKRASEIEETIESCEVEVTKLYKVHGSLEEKLTTLETERQTLREKMREKAAYDYFKLCMSQHGIASEILKRRLPVINAEISKVLCNVVEFEVYLEVDDKSLDIMIRHPKYDPRPIELGSGAEKTLAAIAIRLALLNVSTLPRGDIFILDEPGTALDENNMEGFSRIVDMIKMQFNKVVLISHLASLKDVADVTIAIDKKDGFAHINQ